MNALPGEAKAPNPMQRPSLAHFSSASVKLEATGGILMAPLAPSIVAGILAAVIVLALIMNQVKVWLFARFKMA